MSARAWWQRGKRLFNRQTHQQGNCFPDLAVGQKMYTKWNLELEACLKAPTTLPGRNREHQNLALLSDRSFAGFCPEITGISVSGMYLKDSYNVVYDLRGSFGICGNILAFYVCLIQIMHMDPCQITVCWQRRTVLQLRNSRLCCRVSQCWLHTKQQALQIQRVGRPNSWS